MAEIAALERDGAVTAAADRARLEQQIVALRTASDSDRAIASAREADLVNLLDELRVVAAAETRKRLESTAHEAELRADLKAKLDAAAQREANLISAGEREFRRLASDTDVKIAALQRDLATARRRAEKLRDAMARREQSAQFRICELERREQDAITAAMQLSHSEDRLRAIISSRSWILTTPLRWLLREQTLDQASRDAALVSVLPPFTLPVGSAEPQDDMTLTSQSAHSVIDLLSLAPPDLVCQSFQLLLGRAPSATEQRARERSLYLGCGRIAMIAEIHRSVEAANYRRRHREQGSDTEFIEWLYQNYLGRSADSDGLAHYEDLIQRKSRAAVEADVAASDEAADYRSLPYELERLVKIHQRSRQCWRWFSRRLREQRINNIESEACMVRIIRHGGIEQDQIMQTMDAMREQADRAFASLAAREANLRVELDHARIDTQNALALIRDDAQARFDRLVESQRAEQAAAAPSIYKVDASHLGPQAREILQRMRTSGAKAGNA